MILNRLILKNFGKFSEQEILLKEGINIIYGGNESGKSTVCSFIQGIFFGLRRLRGKASRTDDYTRYTPWKNPAWYEGAVHFTCGEKRFCLERNFAAGSQGTRLYCQTDGELLSVEDGDLEMLLGGVSQIVFQNTVCVGQLKSRTEEGLLLELRDYLAGCQSGGDIQLNPERAIIRLREKKKFWESKEEQLTLKRGQEEERFLDRIDYRKKEMEALREKILYLEKKKEERRELQNPSVPETGGKKIRVFLYSTAAVLAMLLLAWRGLPFFGGAGILLLGLILEFWIFRRKRYSGENSPQEENMEARMEVLREELEERRTSLSNLREAYEEFIRDYEELLSVKKELDGLTLAEKKIRELALQMKHSAGGALKERMSEILSGITCGRYQKVMMDEKFQISLYNGEKAVPLYQVSTGTVEQVYLALRMASAEILCREEELPVLLDETLAFYDDQRLLETLLWLRANRKQVILFTCTEREIQALKAGNISCHVIRL